MAPVAMCLYVVCAVLLVLLGGLMSGLTLGLLSLDTTTLQVLENCGTEKERSCARKIRPLVSRHHLLLTTLLLVNAAAMEALPVLLDELVSTYAAIIISVTVVLAFGEIIPQEIRPDNWYARVTSFTIHLREGARCTWFVWLLVVIVLPIGWPVSKLLDFILGPSHQGTFYPRRQLAELVKIHGEHGLTQDEVDVISGALELQGKTVAKVMTPLEHVFMLSDDEQLDMATRTRLVESGHSRVPVCHSGDRNNVVGVVLVKQLIILEPSLKTPVASLNLQKPVSVSSKTALFDALNLFLSSRSHLVLVHNEEDSKYAGALISTTQQILRRIIGIVTLEDVIEELIQEEIVDETDQYIDVAHQVRVQRSSTIHAASTLKEIAISQQHQQQQQPRSPHRLTWAMQVAHAQPISHLRNCEQIPADTAASQSPTPTASTVQPRDLLVSCTAPPQPPSCTTEQRV